MFYAPIWSLGKC